MEAIEEGDRVLFITQKGRKYLLEVRRGRRFHSSEGYIDLEQVMGMPYGSRIKTNTGSVWVAAYPLIIDQVLNFPRITQIVYPKDLGYIVLMSGIRSGSRVVEGGTGAAVLTTILAYYVAPTGKVYSYDVVEDHLRNAEKQLEKVGLRDFVELKHGDLTKQIEERDIDAVILDIPTPWLAVANAKNALRDGGVLVSISPTIEQVIETVEALKNEGFADVITVEILMRTLRVKRGMTRPEHLMHAHTAYITTARKAYREGEG
ncbi:MAG: tRNA (adenine-N1)-methyltransferase [Nitrososphaeria archaeon]|nr:tRNA (adenine-N1)-methyltransferase [Nitrososphaeria archaeon]